MTTVKINCHGVVMGMAVVVMGVATVGVVLPSQDSFPALQFVKLHNGLSSFQLFLSFFNLRGNLEKNCLTDFFFIICEEEPLSSY